MENNYIIKKKNNTLLSINVINSKLVSREYADEKWSNEVILVENARTNFTINVYKEEIYIFSQDMMGSIMLTTSKNDTWSSKIILQNQGNKTYTIFFNSIITDTGLTLVYNSPTSNEDGSYMLMQQLQENGVWTKATTIDKFYPLKKWFFTMESISESHFILYYQTKTANKNIGYREITTKNCGKYNVFHTTNYQIVDTSFLTTKEGIYTTYVVKSTYSSQLIFRKKEGENFSNQIILCENQNIDNSIIFYSSGVLYVFFTSGTTILYTTSNNNGETFKKVQRYKSNVGGAIIKGKYLSTGDQSKKNLFLNDIYVGRNSLHIAKIIPEINSEFYPSNLYVSDENSELEEIVQNVAYDDELIQDYENKILVLQNKVMNYERELVEKNNKILSLMSDIRDKSDELSMMIKERKVGNKISKTTSDTNSN